MANALFELSQAAYSSGGCSPVGGNFVDSTDLENNDDLRDILRAEIHEDPNEDTTSIYGSQDQENRPLCDIGSLPYTLTLSIPNSQNLEWTGTMSLPYIRGVDGQGSLSVNLYTTMGMIELGWNMTFTERQSTSTLS